MGEPALSLHQVGCYPVLQADIGCNDTPNIIVVVGTPIVNRATNITWACENFSPVATKLA